MTEQNGDSVPKKYKVGVEAALEVMGGKWKPLIIYHLMTGQKRTSELLRLIPGLTQKVLTAQLRGLENDEIISRTIYQEIPPRVEYGDGLRLGAEACAGPVMLLGRGASGQDPWRQVQGAGGLLGSRERQREKGKEHGICKSNHSRHPH